MTIEQKINKILRKYWTHSSAARFMIENWRWRTTDSCTRLPLVIDGNVSKTVLNMRKKIINIIKNADEAECLTSPSQYIRECKKFFIANPNWKVEKLIKDYGKKKSLLWKLWS